jgi:cell division protein FtsB
MVSRQRLHTFLTGLGLYAGAALLIGYFAVNAYIGNRGLRAQQDLDQEYSELSQQLERLRIERTFWQRRVELLRAESIDPDMLDERTRAVLNYLDAREITLIKPRR